MANGTLNGWVDYYRVTQDVVLWTSDFGPTPTVTPTATSSALAANDYHYADSAHVHAVTSLSGGSSNTYTYDANPLAALRGLRGNMTQRVVSGVTYNLVYDGSNRVSSITWAGAAAHENYIYDGDGNRVATIATNDVLTAYFAGGSYEVTADSNGNETGLKKYYDHLGSALPGRRTRSEAEW